jgi:hypothetical protein
MGILNQLKKQVRARLVDRERSIGAARRFLGQTRESVPPPLSTSCAARKLGPLEVRFRHGSG